MGQTQALVWRNVTAAMGGLPAVQLVALNEVPLYQNEGDRAEQGFKTILTGPAYPPSGPSCPAPGHQLGFNDLR